MCPVALRLQSLDRELTLLLLGHEASRRDGSRGPGDPASWMAR
jgi:hypothetical protein